MCRSLSPFASLRVRVPAPNEKSPSTVHVQISPLPRECDVLWLYRNYARFGAILDARVDELGLTSMGSSSRVGRVVFAEMNSAMAGSRATAAELGAHGILIQTNRCSPLPIVPPVPTTSPTAVNSTYSQSFPAPPPLPPLPPPLSAFDNHHGPITLDGVVGMNEVSQGMRTELPSTSSSQAPARMGNESGPSFTITAQPFVPQYRGTPQLAPALMSSRPPSLSVSEVQLQPPRIAIHSVPPQARSANDPGENYQLPSLSSPLSSPPPQAMHPGLLIPPLGGGASVGRRTEGGNTTYLATNQLSFSAFRGLSLGLGTPGYGALSLGGPLDQRHRGGGGAGPWEWHSGGTGSTSHGDTDAGNVGEVGLLGWGDLSMMPSTNGKGRDISKGSIVSQDKVTGGTVMGGGQPKEGVGDAHDDEMLPFFGSPKTGDGTIRVEDIGFCIGDGKAGKAQGQSTVTASLTGNLSCRGTMTVPTSRLSEPNFSYSGNKKHASSELYLAGVFDGSLGSPGVLSSPVGHGFLAGGSNANLSNLTQTVHGLDLNQVDDTRPCSQT